MRRLLIGIAAIALAGPAAAQPDLERDRDEDIRRAIPPAEQIEVVGETIDRTLGAVLDIPIGPLVDAIDAADPAGRRHRRYGRYDRIRDVAGLDDPYFEERLRDQIHGVTIGMGAMAEHLAVIAPEMRRALERVEHDVARAMDDARARAEERRGRR